MSVRSFFLDDFDDEFDENRPRKRGRPKGSKNSGSRNKYQVFIYLSSCLSIHQPRGPRTVVMALEINIRLGTESLF